MDMVNEVFGNWSGEDPMEILKSMDLTEEQKFLPRNILLHCNLMVKELY
jgi:hypothetical protein